MFDNSMKSEPVSFRLGDTAVSIFMIGHLRADLAAWYKLSPGDVAVDRRMPLERPYPLPVQSILIKQSTRVLLIDAPRYDIATDSPYAIPGYQPPPGLVAQLRQVGVTPNDVTHVIITHPHFDHINGLTEAKDDAFAPVFVQAKHYLARPDWEMPEMQQALAVPDSLERNTLGVLRQRGLLELVDGVLDFGSDVRILSAPGETPGHQIVRVESGGQVLYCVGDLFHHELELWRPGTAVYWADPEAMASSQQQLIESARAEDALVVAAHIAGYGRLVQETGEWRLEIA